MHRRLHRFIIFSFLFISGAGDAWCVSYYVNDGSLSGDVYTTAIGNNGNSGLLPALPKASLSAIFSTYGPLGTNVLTTGDIIFIDAGTYFTTDANLNLSVNGLSIIGAGSSLTFFDNNSTSVDANRWANVTGNNITIQGVYLTGYNYGLGGATTLQFSGVSGVVVTDVQINENTSGGGSSAIVINGGSTINFVGGGSNCNPIGPSIAGGGVNIEGNGNNVSFTNYTLTGNSKSAQGGSGMYISGNNTTFVTVINSTIANNVNTSANGGAGIYLSGANLSMTGCCISGNSTSGGSGPQYGGGVTLARGATASFSNCSFTGNSVTNSGKGGAISINTSFTGSGTSSSVSLVSCSFSGNTADSEGNHIYLRVGSGNAASVAINECSFTATAEDVRQDNTGTVTVQNSGNPVLSGTGITVVNTINPVTTPATFCPPASVACFSMLPVELISLEATCDEATTLIEWITASERDNDYFLIEKIAETGEAKLIATITGAGNSQTPINYQYRDTEYASGMSYYRLSQLDFDGHRTTFDLISSDNCSELRSSRCYFNRSENCFHLFLSTAYSDVEHVEVVTLLGENVPVFCSPTESSTTQKIELLQPLSIGTYFVRLTFSDHDEVIKTIIY
jgi:hypothetical protein